MAQQLTAEDLLASGAATFTVKVPAALLRGGPEGNGNGDHPPGVDGAPWAGEIVLRPLLVRDVDRVVRAAREQRVLSSVLMVQQALVAPRLSVSRWAACPRAWCSSFPST